LHKSSAAAAAAALVAGAALFAAARRPAARPSLTMAASSPKSMDMPYGAELEAAMAAVRLASSLCEVRERERERDEGWVGGEDEKNLGVLTLSLSLSHLSRLTARPSQAA
jgi:hypothetical protein